MLLSCNCFNTSLPVCLDFKRQAFEEDDQSALNSSRKRKQCKPRRVMADANQVNQNNTVMCHSPMPVATPS